MKSIYRLLVFLVAGMAQNVFAEVEVRDTLLDLSTPSKVIIVENENGTYINVSSTDKEKDFKATVAAEYSSGSKVSASQKFIHLPFRGQRNMKNKKAGKWDGSVDGICIGLTNSMNQGAPGGLQWSKSFEISWLSCLNVNYTFWRSRISLGLGFDWRNYKITTSDRCLVANTSGGLEWGSYPENSKARYSRLKVFSLQFPLFYEWYIPKSYLKFKAGPIFNFNTYASLKTIYENGDGNRCMDFTKNVSQRPFTVDLFGTFSFYNAIGIYVRYSPMKVMERHSPINFTPFTVGIGFGI